MTTRNAIIEALTKRVEDLELMVEKVEEGECGKVGFGRREGMEFCVGVGERSGIKEKDGIAFLAQQKKRVENSSSAPRRCFFFLFGDKNPSQHCI